MDNWRVSGFSYPFRQPKIKPGSREKMNQKIRTKDLALTTIYAALYAALVIIFTPISFGLAQFRVAGILRPGIAKKWILAFGYGIGALVANFFSPFAGPWDLVFMPVMSVVAGLAGYFVAKRFGGNYFICGAVTAAIIAVSLSFMFEQLGIAPMLVAVLPLFVVEQAVCLIGGFIFLLIGKRFTWWKT
jgi:uncharacterized membrane protein